jgi:hypothetical protein
VAGVRPRAKNDPINLMEVIMQTENTNTTTQISEINRSSEAARREADQRIADEQFAAWVLGWGYSAGRVLPTSTAQEAARAATQRHAA